VDVCNTKRYKEIPVLKAGPSVGTAKYGSKFGGSLFEGIPKAREMKAYKTLVLNAQPKAGN
jgi:hypothetical protein